MNKYEQVLKKKKKRTYESRLSIKIKEDELEMIKILIEQTGLDLRGVIYWSMKTAYESLKNGKKIS